MGSYTFSASILSFFLLATLVSSSPFISDDIFEHNATSGRALLQQDKKACAVDFEKQNYRIITNPCKGPQYPAKICCAAFKQFACPLADIINDMTTDCASVMFSYINYHGEYPPGLFYDKCKEGKEGLDCGFI